MAQLRMEREAAPASATMEISGKAERIAEGIVIVADKGNYMVGGEGLSGMIGKASRPRVP